MAWTDIVCEIFPNPYVGTTATYTRDGKPPNIRSVPLLNLPVYTFTDGHSGFHLPFVHHLFVYTVYFSFRYFTYKTSNLWLHCKKHEIWVLTGSFQSWYFYLGYVMSTRFRPFLFYSRGYTHPWTPTDER